MPTFSLERPSYKVGDSISGKFNAPPIDTINRRNGQGNYDLQRHNAIASTIRPRFAGDFDKLQAIDLELQGAKIQLSDKTIEELFSTKVGDKTDTQWLAERDRLIIMYKAKGLTSDQIDRELEVNKPLGREQRKVSSKQNIGQSSLTTNDKISELKQEVMEGRAESQKQQATITGQLALIFADTQAVDKFTQLQLTDLSQTVSKLNLPRDHKQLGLMPRYVDIDYYNVNAGLVNLFLFSNVASDPHFMSGINYDTPVYNFASKKSTADGLPAMKFTSMITAMGNKAGGRRYLDLHRRGVINQTQLRSAVTQLQSGFANPDVSVSPAHQ